MPNFPTTRRVTATLLASFAATTLVGVASSMQDRQERPDLNLETFQERTAITHQREVDRGTPEAIGSIDVGRGPIPVHIPTRYDGSVPTGLIVLLHGYQTTGQEVEDWMQFASLVDEYNFLYIYPTGVSDFLGNPYWNATDACCDLFGGNPDDSTYLRDVIEAMQAQYNVDPRRIHFAGHSNGGFMSYRMACDHADLIASIASLAGATHLNPQDCVPVEPVHTLQIHGTADGVISYNGGCLLGDCYPSAIETCEMWATYNGCGLVGTPQPDPLDLDASIAGAETTVAVYDDGCVDGGSTQLWTMANGVHSPVLSADFSPLVIEYLLSHPKPSPCAADLDGDDIVALTDLLALLASWGPCDGCVADLDGNGDVDATDLLTLLAAWGGCA